MSLKVFMVILAVAINGASIAQQCTGNLISNPDFSKGFTAGWEKFGNAYMAHVLSSNHKGCIDIFADISIKTTYLGGMAQDFSFKSDNCYDFCLCIASSLSNKTLVFAAMNDSAVTYESLVNFNFTSGTAQLIDSFNPQETGIPYCKKNWRSNNNFNRIIILPVLNAGETIAEVWVDNVCLITCTPAVLPDNGTFEGLRIMNSSEKVMITFDHEPFDIELLEITGKTVRTLNKATSIELNANEFNKGVYVIRIAKDGMIYTRRIAF